MWIVYSEIVVHDLLIQPENIRGLQRVTNNRISAPHSLILKRIVVVVVVVVVVVAVVGNQRVLIDNRIPATNSIRRYLRQGARMDPQQAGEW